MLLPKTVFVFSGKRKSGKDYIAEKLQILLGKDFCSLVRLSAPLKQKYAEENNLDYEQLLSSSAYKELYRQDMIKWGEEKRDADPGYFCRAACSMQRNKSMWIVTDARRPTDIQFFKDLHAMVFLVRIEANDHTRVSRGWEFVSGVDDCASECALDSFPQWDFIIKNNNGNEENLNQQIQQLLKAADV